jgi:arginase
MGALLLGQDSPVDEARRVAIIGAELDLGAGRRGVDMGPSAIRYAGLGERLAALGIASEDWGNVYTQIRETADPGDPNARFLPQIRETCEQIADRVRQAAEGGLTPLVLGGDHSVAIGSIGGLASLHGPGAVLWFDAHGDLNTPETTPSGNVHGMPLAAALGRAGAAFESERWPLPSVEPNRVALIGIRSLDPGEREVVKETGIASTRSRTSTAVESSPCSSRRWSEFRVRRSFTSLSISMWWTRMSRRAWGRPFAADSRTGRRT